MSALATGVRNEIAVVKTRYRVEIREPQDGAVHVAGDAVRVTTWVWDDRGDEATRVMDRPATIACSAGDIAGAGDIVLLPTAAREVEITATFEGEDGRVVRDTRTVRCVVPHVAHVQVVDAGDGSVLPVYSHEAKGLAAASFAFGEAGGRPVKGHPAAALAGRKVALRVSLACPPGATPLAAEETGIGLALGGFAGEGKIARDGTATVELAASEPLPFAVEEASLAFAPEIEVRAEADPGSARMVSLPPVLGITIFALFGKPVLGDGQALDPRSDPLLAHDFDAFHLRHACRLANGGTNLLLDDEGSIPLAVVSAIHHYAPDEYAGKDGRREHPAPKNQASLQAAAPGLHDPSGEVCGTCGGSVDAASGACTECARPVADLLRCRRCKRPLEGDRRACAHDRALVGRFVDGSIRCPRCRTLVRADLYYDAADPAHVRYFDGSKLSDAARAKLRPIDHCPRLECGRPLLVRVDAGCRSCGAFVPEEDLLSGAHDCPAGEAGTVGVDEHERHTHRSFGLAVLDHPTHPGGRSDQQASCIAAFLNLLGIKARVLSIRGRKGSAVNTTEHDPITRGASSFEPSVHWGRTLHAIVYVPVDRSRDAEAGGRRLNEDEATCYDAGGRRAMARVALRPGHELRKRGARTGKCRLGHVLKAAKAACEVCGAQPEFAYLCGKCGKAVGADDDACAACGEVLTAAFAASIVYPCPSCGRTVRESDEQCWSCSGALAKRTFGDGAAHGA